MWDVGKPSLSSSSQAAEKPLPSGCCCWPLPGKQAGQRGILGRWFLPRIRLIKVGKHTQSCLGDCALQDASTGQTLQPPEPISGASGPLHPFTCRHEEDAGTKDDVVSGFVELAGCNAESTHEKQNHTQDRENTRGSNSPCRGERERGRKNSAGVRERKKGHGNSAQDRGTSAHFVGEGKGERQREMCRSGGVIQGETKASGDGRRETETKYVRKREQSKATRPCPGCRCCCEAGGRAWEEEGGCGGWWLSWEPACAACTHFALFSSAFRGFMGWRGSPGTIQLLLRGTAARASSSKNSNPNASRRAAQSQILPKGHEHLKEILHFFRTRKELLVLHTALQLH